MALDHLPGSPEAVALAIDLRFELRNVLIGAEDVKRIRPHLDVAERLASTLGDRARLARVLVYRSTVLWLSGDHASAIQRASTALEIAVALGDTRSKSWRGSTWALPTTPSASIGRQWRIWSGDRPERRERLQPRLGMSVIARCNPGDG